MAGNGKVTVKDISELCGVRTTSVLAWLKKGELRGRKVKGRWHIRPSDLDIYLNNARRAVPKRYRPNGQVRVYGGIGCARFTDCFNCPTKDCTFAPGEGGVKNEYYYRSDLHEAYSKDPI